jgi:hypothetical protein
MQVNAAKQRIAADKKRRDFVLFIMPYILLETPICPEPETRSQGSSRTGIVVEHSPVSTAGRTIKLWKEGNGICREVEAQTLIEMDLFFLFPRRAAFSRRLGGLGQ